MFQPIKPWPDFQCQKEMDDGAESTVSSHRSLKAIEQTLNWREREEYQALLGAASVMTKASDIRTVSNPKGTSTNLAQELVTVYKAELLLLEGVTPCQEGGHLKEA